MALSDTNESFRYEYCDVPDGLTLTEWRVRHVRPSHRRAQVAGGFLAAVATIAPVVLSVRGSRTK
jgi:hypothetical protein